MKRTQRRREPGWRRPDNVVYVGRPSYWGNPFVVGRDGTAEEVCAAYRQYAIEAGNLWLNPLRGHDLECWCPLACKEEVRLYEVAYGDQWDLCAKPAGHDGAHDPSAPRWCHADVLLDLIAELEAVAA